VSLPDFKRLSLGAYSLTFSLWSAEGLRRPTFQPPVQITAPDIDPMMDQGKLLFVVEIPPNFQSDVRARRKTGVQINVDDRGRAGRQRRELSQNRHRQRDPPETARIFGIISCMGSILAKTNWVRDLVGPLTNFHFYPEVSQTCHHGHIKIRYRLRGET